MVRSVIRSTGSYIPEQRVPNDYFLNHEFYDRDGKRIERPNPEIISKLFEITGIKERRYADDNQITSIVAWEAAKRALEGVDPESLDYIIVGQNLGDVRKGNVRCDMVPNIASRVKHYLKIRNPYCVAMDIPFGCPGWLQGMIMADYLIRSGDARRILVIGAELLSRVVDPHDIDTMIFADGAGASLVEATDGDAGIMAHLARSDTYNEAFLLTMDFSNRPDHEGDELFLKMKGHDIYKYALKRVPELVKACIAKAGVNIGDVKKIFIHQANEKMDRAIIERIFKLYGISRVPESITPMMISWTGNSSVATLPTLLDLVLKGRIDGHQISPGDIVVFASVGAGMHINSMVYKMP